MNGSIGECLRTTVGVRQGCLLLPTLFNIFLERIMSDALEKHDGKISIGGRNITNLRFAEDIDALAEEEQELEATVESLGKTCTRYKMEISADKTKLMTSSANGTQKEIKIKGQNSGTVTSAKYLVAAVSDDGSKLVVLSRFAKATAALTKLKRRKENPQKLTQLSSRSHPRHLVGKMTAQKDTIIGITSDSKVNSNFPYRWSPASLTFNNLFLPIFIFIYNVNKHK